MGHCFPSQVKAKRYWLVSPTGMLKKPLNKLITVKNLLSLGMEARSMGIRNNRVARDNNIVYGSEVLDIPPF